MAWVAITNNPNWQYNNSPEDPGAGSPLRALWLKQTNGIRTIGSGAGAHQVYSEVRRVGDTTNRSRGELSKSYWDAREGTLSSYAVNNFDPKLVFDFTGNVFKTGGGISTFSNSITHARAGQATMVDSDGLLKWAPHNLLTHSGDLTNSGWTNSNLTVTTGQNDFEGNPTAFKMTPTASSGVHRLYKTTANSNLVNGILMTVTIEVKADGYNFFSVAVQNTRYAIINLSDGTVSLDVGSVSPTVTSLGNGWYRCSITSSAGTQEVFSVGETFQNATFGSSTFTGDGTSGVLMAYPHAYRSGVLGGMVNNSATGNSYVPTTSSAVYLPRVGHHIYNGSAWVNEGILHESEARTNLVTNSGNLSNGFALYNTQLVSSGVTVPDGSTDAYLLYPNSSGVSRFIYSQTLTQGATQTSSIYMKASGVTTGLFYSQNGGGLSASGLAWFDLSAGTVGTVVSGYTATIEDVGNGWYRCSVSGVTLTNRYLAFGVADADNSTTVTKSGTDGILLWGAQAEAGATPSSYIPTTSSTATRAPETLTVPAAKLPYSSTNVSTQMNGKMTYADNNSFNEVAFLRQFVTGNYLKYSLYTNSSNTGKLDFTQYASAGGGSKGVNTSGSYFTPGINVPFNIAGRHGSTFVNGAEGGSVMSANTSMTALPNLSSADLELGETFMGTIGKFRMWDEDIGDTGIAIASS